MARLGPFESHPHLAVAVSGGRDSLALTLLAQAWVGARGGALTALIVEHGLRPESAAEAGHIAALLHGRGIAVEILPWRDAKPVTGVSEAARLARYRLLQQRCRALGILHLLLAHQQGDQAETVMLRLADASGPEGLAGMAAVAERRHLRLLRPLLGIERQRLAATVLGAGLRWVDDPGNDRANHARIAIRQSLDADARQALADVAATCAAVRHGLDRRLAALLIELVSVDPRGFAWLDRAGFAAIPDLLARRLLGRLCAVFGGRLYPARLAGLVRAADSLQQGRNAVAGGCRFVVGRSRILVCREAGAIAARPAPPAGSMLWDRRYRLDLPAGLGRDRVLAALGAAGRAKALQNDTVGLRELPAAAAEALPALWRGDALDAVFLPSSTAKVAGLDDGRGAARPATVISCLGAVFQPAQGLVAPAWPLVLPPDAPMYLDRQTFSLRGRS